MIQMNTDQIARINAAVAHLFVLREQLYIHPTALDKYSDPDNSFYIRFEETSAGDRYVMALMPSHTLRIFQGKKPSFTTYAAG